VALRPRAGGVAKLASIPRLRGSLPLGSPYCLVIAPAAGFIAIARRAPPRRRADSLAIYGPTAVYGLATSAFDSTGLLPVFERTTTVGVFVFHVIPAVVRPDYFPKGSMQLTRERHDEIEDSLSYLGVAHGGESAAQLKTFARDERVGDLALSFVLNGVANAPRYRGNVLEEVGDRDIEKIGKLLQATGADPVRPFLVLLDLLQADIERFAHLGLAHFQGDPAHSQACSNLRIDGGWRFHRPTLDRARDDASCLNAPAAKVWWQCDGETSVAGIAARVGAWPDEHADAGDAYPRGGDRVSVSFVRFDHGGRTSLARF
jgi:hypothetical protein